MAVCDESSRTSPAHLRNPMISTLSTCSLTALTHSALRRFRIGAPVSDDSAAAPMGATLLQCHQTLWVARPLGLLVRCESGTLWLVFDRDRADVVLEPGEELLCTRQAKLSIHAMTCASVRLGPGALNARGSADGARSDVWHP
jgi:hypothetical protein